MTITLTLAIVSFALTFLTWLRGRITGGKFLTLLMAVNSFWLFSYIMELLTDDATIKLFWMQFRCPMVASIPTILLVFTLDFTGWWQRMNRTIRLTLLIEPLATLILAWTNSTHHLVWEDVQAITLGGYTFNQPDYGPWVWFHIVYTILIVGSGAVIVWRHAPHSPYSLHYQSNAILIAIGLASAGLVLDLLSLRGMEGIRFNSMMIIVGAGILIASSIIHQMRDILPLARDAILENMSDGVVILDKHNRIIDINQSAREILEKKTDQIIGIPISSVYPAWPDIPTLPQSEGEISKEIQFPKDEGWRTYELRTSAILSAQSHLNGHLVVLRDITRQKQAEDALRRRDQILQSVSYAAEQFLKSTTWDQNIEEILARLGEATQVSRVCLFCNILEHDHIYDRLRSEWVAPNMRPLAEMEELRKEDMATRGYQRWIELMSRGQPVYGRLCDLPESEQAALRKEDVLSVAVVPIFVAQQWWGYIGFDDCVNEREWSSVEMDALRAAASTMGAAILRQQSEEEIRRWNYFIITLLEVSEMIGTTLDVTEVLDQIAMAVRNLLPIDRVAVFMWDENEQALLPTMPIPSSGLRIALKDEQLEAYKNLRLSVDNTPLVKELLEKNAVVAISDISDSVLVPAEMVKLFGTQSLLAAPIVFQERFTGVLYLESVHQKHDFSAQEINLATALARQAGLAIERSRMYAQSKNDAAELAALYRSSAQLLNPGSDLKNLAEHITNTVVHEFDSTVCSLHIIDQDTLTVKLLAQVGFPEGHDTVLPVDGPGIVAAAARLGEMIYVPDVSKDARYLKIESATRSELAFPLRVGDWIIGVLNLENSQLNGYDERARRILASYADNAALALQNVRLFNAANIHARQLSQLNDITRTAISSVNFKETLQKLADQLVGIVGSDECFINLWDDGLQMVLPGAANGKTDATYQMIPAMQGEASMTRAVLQSGEPLFVADVLNSEFTSNRVSEHFATKAALALPMIIGDQKLGSVIFGFFEPRQITRREISLCKQFADQVGLAISKSWALELAHQRAQEADNLRQATAAISSSLDLNQVLDSVLVHLEPVVPYDSACIFLVEGEYLHVVACRGFPNPDLILDQRYLLDDLYLETVKFDQPTIILDAQQDPRFSNWGNTDYVHGWMGVPLHGRDSIIGHLTLDSRQAGAFNEHSATLALAFAGQAAVAIENSRLFEAARQRAQEAETLRQAGAKVAASLQQDEAIQFILEQLARVVPYVSASVQLLNEGYLEVMGGVGWPGGLSKIIGLRFEIPGNNPNTTVIQNRQPYILGDAQAAYEGFKIMPHIVSWMGVPLIFRESVIGMLTMDSDQLNYFTLDHARLASAFADQVAIAIENARLYAAEQNRVKHLDALRATAADLSAELEISRLLETILRRAITLLGASGGELGLHYQQADILEIVASYNMGTDYTGTRMEMGEGVMGLVAETLQPLVIDDYTKWDGRSQQYQNIPWKSVMAAPLMVHGRLVGTIGIVDSNPERHFKTNDLGLLTMFAQQAAIAVENARLYQEAKMAAEKRSILHRVSQEVVTASFDPEQIYTAIYGAATQMMPVDAFTITLVDEETDEIEAVYLIDRNQRSPSMRSPKNQGLSGKVISSGQSIYFDDFIKEQSWNGVHFGSESHTRSILAVPLRTGDHVIGMISAQSYEPHAYSTEEQYLLEMLAAHAAIAIQNTRLIKQIQWLAITDPLTGLFNRRGLFDLGQREVERFRRFGRPFVAIMLDIDLFKIVNDTYGHNTGDQVLIALANELKERVRDVDVVGRYGGEELVVVLPETDLEGGIQAAERLRIFIENMPIPTDRGLLSITISMGVAEFHANIPDLATLIDRADSAMYQAKQAGRNQVRGYQK
ncbi:MAG: GAF domain-containing protein [Anaerolineales bacterium]|nr:GAF domain-containing protein [Anaerolineales bacterium]